MKHSTKRLAQKTGALALAAAVTVVMCPTAAIAENPTAGQEPVPAQTTTATKPTKTATKNLKQRGVKFNLKKDKWVKFKSPTIGGYLTYKGRVTKLKTTEAKKAGYKTSTFRLEIKLAKEPTRSQGIKCAKYAYKYGDDTLAFAYWIVDYTTGENLEYKKNAQKVTYKESWGKTDKLTKKYHYKNLWWRFLKSTNAKITVTYPESYQNLAVGIGAPLKRSWVKNTHDRGFSNGKKATWYKTSGFKRDIKNYHFMRIA